VSEEGFLAVHGDDDLEAALVKGVLRKSARGDAWSAFTER